MLKTDLYSTTKSEDSEAHNVTHACCWQCDFHSDNLSILMKLIFPSIYIHFLDEKCL